jgi:hypothetical protein
MRKERKGVFESKKNSRTISTGLFTTHENGLLHDITLLKDETGNRGHFCQIMPGPMSWLLRFCFYCTRRHRHASWYAEQHSSDSHILQLPADSLLGIGVSSQSYMCVPRLVTSSMLQVIRFPFCWITQLGNKFHSVRNPKIKFRVQEASLQNLPEVSQKQVRSALFCDFTRCRMVVPYDVSEPKVCPETLVWNYHSTLLKLATEHKYHLHRGGSLKSCTWK